MIKRYRTKVVGDGKTIETARKPEIWENPGWNIVLDLGNYMIVDVEEIDVSKYEDTQEI